MFQLKAKIKSNLSLENFWWMLDLEDDAEFEKEELKNQGFNRNV